ncbi:uncharacterized protein LOC142331259 [Lycorma delicatula]|uniref:uncharacterized protein LOC142331259 n=1 Tax=Lycorma delicatula TaxID=130591 RepID=UPI003F512918
MKTIFFIFAVIFLSFHGSNARLSKYYTEKIQSGCADEIKKITPEEKKIIENDELPVTEDGKCYITCGLRQIGCLKDDKVNIEVTFATFEGLIKDKTIQHLMISMISDCIKKENNFVAYSGCELGFKFMECLIKNTEFAKVKDYLEEEYSPKKNATQE